MLNKCEFMLEIGHQWIHFIVISTDKKTIGHRFLNVVQKKKAKKENKQTKLWVALNPLIISQPFRFILQPVGRSWPQVHNDGSG